MSWFENLIPPKIKTVGRIGRKGVPEGLWTKCNACQAVLYGVELERSLHVCPKCNNHMRFGARQRLTSFLDQGSIHWIGEEVRPVDALKFRDQKRYRDRLSDARKSSKSSEALLAAKGTLEHCPVTAVAFEFGFMGGSMGSVVGERFVRAAAESLEAGDPFICFSASGGARMQEALFSLMQMSKTTAAIARLRENGIPFISVLTDPTMGGVSASLAMLGDVIIAEPRALVGFAGPRVIEQTVRETLPEGFQRAEFLLEHGAIDMIVNRSELRPVVFSLLRKLGFGAPIATDDVEARPDTADAERDPESADEDPRDGDGQPAADRND